MSEHEWVQENLDAYVAGALPAQELGRVAQHVADCADCKHALAQVQKLEASLADLFADARPDAKLEDRMIRRLGKVRGPMRWPAWTRFAIGAAAVVLLGVVGAIVQAVAGGGGLPGPLGEFGARTQSRNDLNRLATTYYHRETDAKLGTLDADLAASQLSLDTNSMMERLGDVSVPGSQTPEAKRVYPTGDLVVPLDDSKSMGKPDFGIPINNHSFSFNGRKKVQEAGIDQGKGEQNLGESFKGGKGTSLSLHGLQAGGGAGEAASRGGAGKVPDMVSGLTSAGTLTPELAKRHTKTKAFDLDMYVKVSANSTQGYFKPSDSPPGDGPPAPGAGASPDGGGPPKGTDPALTPPPALPEPAAVFNQPPKQDPPAADSGLKIIRTGEMEFEIDSFDNAIKSVEKLIAGVKGGSKLIGEGKKQRNGKMRGFIIVRMPPEHLNKFVEDVRGILEKTGELRMQRIGSQDVTKQYIDTEGKLKAARVIEERILAIIKNGKGDVKDLVVAEEKLGIVRTTIETMEGEIRYYRDQVALSTLTINLVEKEISAAAALVVNGTVKMRIEVDNVSKAREAAEKAVEEFEGRIVKSDEKQYPAGQVEAIIHAEIKPAKKDAFRKALAMLGIVSSHEDTQSQTTEGGTGPVLTPKRRVNDVLFQIALNNIVNVKPKHSVKLEVVSADVRGSFEKLKDEIARVHKGQIRDAKLDESQDRQRTIATIDFSVPTGKKPDIDKLIAGFGPTLDRVNTQAEIAEVSTEQKFGYNLTLYSIATVEPREKVRLQVEVKDVERKAAEIADLVKEAKGAVNKPKSSGNKQGQTEALLVINVPLASSGALVRQIKDREMGKLIDWVQAPNPSVPENDLATAQILVLLTGPNPLIPTDEGLGSYATKSLYVSFTVFAYCVVTILAGIAFILPWAVVIYAGVWMVRRMSRKPVTTRAGVAPPAEPQKPANG